MNHTLHRVLAIVASVFILAGIIFVIERRPEGPPGTGGHVEVYHPPTAKPGASPVTVTFSSPQGADFNVAGAPTIVATFSQAMVPLAQVSSQPPVRPFQFQPDLPGRYRWIGTHTVTFIPDHLPYATHYTVTIPAGLVSEEGGTLAQAFSWTFETRRPEVAGAWAGSDPSHLSPDSRVYLRFNQPVTPDGIKPFAVLTGTDKTGHASDLAVDVRTLNDRELKSLREDRWTDVTPETVLALVPQKPLPLATDLKLTLKKGYRGAEGSLGADDDDTQDFSTYGPLAYVPPSSNPPIQPQNGALFAFTNPVQTQDLVAHIKFDPPVTVPKDLEAGESSDLTLFLPFKANTAYRFTIDGGLKDVYGQTLGKQVDGQFTTGHYPKYLNLKEGLWSLEAEQPHQLPVGLVNLHSLDVGMEPRTIDTVVPLLQTMDTDHVPEMSLHAWAGVDHDDVVTWKNLSLAPALKGRHGLVWVQVSDPTEDERHPRFRNTLVAVTDLAINLKTSPENTVVWVSTLGGGTPVAGAHVQLRDPGNRVLWNGVTDKTGLATGPGWHALGIKGERWEAPHLYALASLGDDLAVVRSGNIDTWSLGVPANPSGIYPNTECFIFTERGLYRSGEDVHFKGIYREIHDGVWTLRKNASLHLSVSNSRNDKVAHTDVKTDAYGSFDYTLHLSDTAPSGDWSLTATGPTGGEYRNDFQVQAFRPVTFEVKVDPGKASYRLGDTLQAKVSGRYLFGSPVQNGDVTWSVTLTSWYPSWSDWDGFQFGRDPWLSRTDEGIVSATTDTEETTMIAARGQGKLSADGELEVSAPLNVENGDNKSLTIEANVEAAGHRQVSGRSTVPCYAGDFTVGLKAGNDFIEAGKPETVEVVAVDTDGKPQTGHRVHVRLVRRNWDSVRHDPSATWDTQPQDTEIGSVDTTSDTKPVTVELTPKEAGFYYLEATSHDNAGHTLTTTSPFWAYGGGYVSWSRGEGDRIALVADRQHYKPGDVARIMVQNPYESAWALITVERELVLSRRVEKLTGSAPVVEIPLDGKSAPNVYVSVVLIQGRKGTGPVRYDDEGEDMGRPSFKLGYVNLPVDPSGNLLKVDVTPDHNRYGPGDTVTVDLNLKNAQGQPVQGEITLAAVDLGVLNLIGYKTPDAFGDFYGSRSLAIDNAETRLFVLGSHKSGEKGAPGGGGGADMAGMMSNIRKNFKMTAYWNPSIVTDAQGHARVSFKLPDNLSTFRLMAVAQTQASQFGSNQAQIVVNKPLVMTASLPRFTTLGDTFSGGVTVTNNTPQRESVTVHAQPTGVTLVGGADKTVDVPAQGTALVTFDYKAPTQPRPDGGDLAAADMLFSGTMAQDRDDLEVGLPIVTPKVLEAVATAGDTEKDDRESLTVPSDVWPGTSRLEVGMSSTALASLRNALQGLVRYPYGCLEQKLSRVYPMLLAEDMADQFGIADFDQKKAHGYIEAFLREFPTYVKGSGGCTLWGNDRDDENPFVSAYALLFLEQADAHGYRKLDVEDTLHNYVSSLLTLEDAGWKYPYSKSDRLATQCLALYALSVAGDNVDGSINRMWDSRNDLSWVSLAWLMRAMSRSGHFQPQLHQLVLRFQQGVQLDPTSGYIDSKGTANSGWIFDSPVRTTAVVLSALLDSGETAHTPEMMGWLLKHSKAGEWFGTQENAWGLDAALTYLKVMEKTVPDFKATALLDGQTVASETFAGRSTRVATHPVPLSDAQAGKTVPLVLSKAGVGRLYYTLRLFYSPKDGQSWVKDEGLAVDKHLTTTDGKEVTDLKAGQVYLVTLTVVAPRERTYVVVNDPVPAGFEVVNTDFETESHTLGQMLQKAQERDAQDEGTWLGSFNHFEIYDDKVLLFADSLVPGAHRFTYLVRAMYPGQYWQGSTRAEAMYEPETFGGTAAEYVTVSP